MTICLPVRSCRRIYPRFYCSGHLKYVYTADIAKMYQQILVDYRDINYQHILWKGDPSDGPVDYQLLTVTYGMSCAPFLALRVIKCLVANEGLSFSARGSHSSQSNLCR